MFCMKNKSGIHRNFLMLTFMTLCIALLIFKNMSHGLC